MRNLTKITMLFILAALVSCAKNDSASEGMVEFTIVTDQKLEDVTKSNVSDYTTLPGVDAFTITITDASDAVVWTGCVADWNPATTFIAGNYNVTATYGDPTVEGFDKPYFQGVVSFAIKGDETTEVTIPVSLANAVIKVECTEIFKAYYKEYSFKLMRMTSKIADFVQGETRGVFFDPYRFHLEGTLKTETGAVKTFATEEFRSQSAATAYTMILDVANVGGGSITVTLNDNVETVELGDIELND